VTNILRRGPALESSTLSITSTRGTFRPTWRARSLAASSTTPGANTAANSYWSSEMKVRLYLPILSLLLTPLVCRAGADPKLPSASDVVQRMLASDAQRQQSLSGYEGARRYVLINDHMHKSAEMVVRVTGDRDGTKHFEVVSETGWKAAQKHVLRKML